MHMRNMTFLAALKLKRYITYGYPNKLDRKNDVLDLSSHLCHPFAILNLPPTVYIALFDRRTQPNDRNT